MNGKQTTLDDFEGFASEDSDSFFGEPTTLDPVEPGQEEPGSDPKDDATDPEEGKDSKKPDSDPKGGEEEENKDEDFFKSSPEEEEEDDDPNEGAVKLTSDSAKTLSFLKDKGLIELEEGEEITDENSEELLEEKWEKSIELALKDTISDLPDEVKNLIKYSSQGGNPYEYLKKMSETLSSGVNKESDISEESVQMKAVEQDLKMQGYDDEYIETHLKVLKDSGKLESIAKKTYDKIISQQQKEEENQLKAIEDANKDRKEKAKKFKQDISEFVGKAESFKGYKLSKEDAKELPSYISDSRVEMANGKKVSSFQADLFKIMADKEKLVLLSKIVKSDLDLSFVEKQAVSKDAKEKRKNIRNDQGPKTGRQASGARTKKPIWELID